MIRITKWIEEFYRNFCYHCETGTYVQILLTAREVLDEFFLRNFLDGWDVSLAIKPFKYGTDPGHDQDPGFLKQNFTTASYG